VNIHASARMKQNSRRGKFQSRDWYWTL